MRMKNTILLVFIMIILTVLAGCAQRLLARTLESPTESKTITTEGPVAVPVIVSTRTLDDSNDYINVHITYPEISGLRDEATQSIINEKVSNDLMSKAQTIEAQAQEDVKESRLRVKYSMDAGYSVERNDGRVLSIKIDISTYEGGANMSTDAMFINVINKDEAIQPTFSKLYVKPDYETIIDEKIRTLIAKSPESEMFDFQTVSPDQWYYLTDTALAVVFPRYAITPGVYGEPEFLIPFDEISDILIPDVK